ncbi:MAG: YbhB/YbcL family Raf kinase inhibitor-like protein [Alphaproteobacteria bacterium]|nr:YbhB/YbcL family Raf kinase inhibitor-like protein [Alphaproteobacteria bacterium]MCB9975222.1 YbhB/YbcL family Raf kinase inhibitor-like protein [Rhodospirillales bacterium]
MKKTLFACTLAALSVCAFSGSSWADSPPETQAQSTLVLHSTSLSMNATIDNKYVYKGFGCEGENLSPQLSWEGVPAEAKSLAITYYDPDAPTGSGWWHWTVVNIPTSVSEIPEGASGTDAMPAGSVEGRTDFGESKFGGSCPPVGDKPHRYFLTLHALDVEKLDLDANASGALVGFNLNAHSIAQAQIMAVYGR